MCQFGVKWGKIGIGFSPHERDLSFQVPDVRAKFHQNPVKIAYVRARTHKSENIISAVHYTFSDIGYWTPCRYQTSDTANDFLFCPTLLCIKLEYDWTDNIGLKSIRFITTRPSVFSVSIILLLVVLILSVCILASYRNEEYLSAHSAKMVRVSSKWMQQ